MRLGHFLSCDEDSPTLVTCPTVRIHPIVVAQAAPTSAAMLREIESWR